MDPVGIAALVVAALAVIAGISVLRSMVSIPRDKVLDRMERLTQTGLRVQDATPTADVGSFFETILRPFAKIATPKEGLDLSRVERKLIHAGYRGEGAVEMFFGAKLILGILLGGAFLLASSLRVTPIANIELWTLLVTALGFYAPDVWLSSQLNKRQVLIGRALPDTLDLLVTCVEAGLSIEASIQRVTSEINLSAPILGGELGQTMLEIHAGMNRAEAFRRLAERTGLEDLRTLSAMLIQTEVFGTSIAKALRIHSSAMRIRRTHRAEEKGATVSVKMLLPLIFCILPSLFAVLLGPAVVRMSRLLMPMLSGGK